jgi:hypothetical protein
MEDICMWHSPDSLSDESIRAAVVASLAADRRTSAEALRVGVLNGVAHLAGKVGSLLARAAAEELAAQVPGVRGVANRIEAPGAPCPARPINLDLFNRANNPDVQPGE